MLPLGVGVNIFSGINLLSYFLIFISKGSRLQVLDSSLQNELQKYTLEKRLPYNQQGSS